MNLDLMELVRTDFRTSKQADEINTRFQNLLGLPHRYGPARLAIGVSLAQDGLPPVDAEAQEDLGKPIKGENLFGAGAEMATWLALISERHVPAELSKKDVQAAVAAHWARGIALMWETWKYSEHNFDRFLLHFAERAGLRSTGGQRQAPAEAGDRRGFADVRATPVRLSIGDPGIDLSSDEPVSWGMNSKGVSPHIAVMGTLGTGKTGLANSFMAQIKQQAPDCALVVFDMGKGDLAADAELVRTLGATVIKSPSQAIPLDVLHVPDRQDTSILDAARRFRDSFSRAPVSKMGSKQLDSIREASLRALRHKSPVTLNDVRDSLRDVYHELRRKDDIASSTFNELCDYHLFTPEMSPKDFFRRSWILDVHEADEMTQRLIVYLVIDAIDTYLTRLPDSPLDEKANRGLRLVVVVDEARKVLGSSQPSLINAVRTARSKGGAVMFITQSPDDFAQEDENFLENIGLALSFRTNAKGAALRAVLGEAVDLAGLPNGVCVTRLPERRGVTRVQAWRPPV